MHDGTLGPFLSGLLRARLTGFGLNGQPQVTFADGATAEASTLVALTPADIGRDAAIASIDGDGVLVVGLLQAAQPVSEIEADVRRITIEARREVVLRCGKASITMTADGRITIRGTQVLSRAEGANRVQGASVQLN
ncbi:hypothetical protein Rumeso_00992 [Rubellimicrobium mesophilum DSM 19309]|uniref:DUF6484 domain-containing protein n=1 Tax=Rubellimicrobium mesophilum DSM 19309 TaxID=442562 RepID=A0A017HTG0_9RHOB|nr:DUF6484 domain-containing protein [Rubellimicrobium mesophilum]EYD77443.1 hypothetical protein Rumeso_00992 [Rubellimicrobium mesophilum DSM 19309]